MWFINENRPIPNNRYFVFVSDNSSLVTATATALYKRIGFEYKNLSATDAGFIGNGTTFLSLLQNSGISEVDAKLRVTDIVVLGGRQDLQKGTANMKPALETFATYCRQHYPLAKVWVGMTGWADCGIDSSSVVNIGIRFQDVVEYYGWANAYGMCYMTNIHYATHFSGFYSDTYTLNNTGLAYVGGHVAECLLNGSTSVHDVQTATATYRSGCTPLGNTVINTGIHDNNAFVYLRNGSNGYCGFDFTKRFITPRRYYAPIPICDLDGVWATGRVNEYPEFASEWGQINDSNGTQTNEWARWLLRGRTLYVQFICTHPNDNVGQEISYQFGRVVFYGNKMIIGDALYC